MSEKIERFLSEKRRGIAFLVLDLDLVVERYRLLKEALPTVGSLRGQSQSSRRDHRRFGA